jgi:hypothetical protein
MQNKALLFVALLAFASLGISSYTLWKQQKPLEITQGLPTPSPTTLPTTSPILATRAGELTLLEEKTSELENRLDALEKKKPSNAPTSKTVARETVLYMGTGSSTSRDWTTIDAAGLTLDTSSYGKIKEVRFEAALSIISGEAEARLINKTTGAVYHNSTVMHNKSTSEWKTSSAIHLPTGNYQYVVQIRSSNNEHASLDGSRLKITVEE